MHKKAGSNAGFFMHAMEPLISLHIHWQDATRTPRKFTNKNDYRGPRKLLHNVSFDAYIQLDI